MKPITLVTNYCNRSDQLDGKDLNSGELLQIQWKDGSITTENINIEESKSMFSGHGEHGESVVRKAYVFNKYHGSLSICYLNQIGILCKRV